MPKATPRLTPARTAGLAIIIAAIGGGYFWFSGEAPPMRQSGESEQAETEAWLNAIRARGRSGDWIAMRGYHAADHLVAGATLKPFSHAAILDLERDEVVEAVSPRVRTVPLAEFVAGSHRFELIRPPATQGDAGEPGEAGAKALERARERLGEPYDFLGTIGLPSEHKSYCSELVAWAWGLQVDRKGPNRVLHPAALSGLGEVIYSAGPRTLAAKAKRDAGEQAR